ncbi:transposase, partial [Saccharococcus caldoxylosilyticus]
TFILKEILMQGLFLCLEILSSTTGYLKYKLNAEGIEMEKKDESYTSQTCPVCGKKNKSSSRNYTCQCGYKQHRDIHGAMNLFAKVYYGEIRTLEFTVKPFTYRRIA